MMTLEGGAARWPCLATPGRVRSRVIIASLKPLFSSPSRYLASTSVSLKVMVAVLDAR